MLTKQSFLENDKVQHFCNYVAKIWTSDFDFYLNKGRGKKSDIVSIRSLQEALNNYCWRYTIKSTSLTHDAPASSMLYQDSGKVLEVAKTMLRAGDDNSLRAGARLILEWGGVTPGNTDRVNKDSFPTDIENVKRYWQAVNTTDVPIGYKKGIGIHSNAGFSKIYSSLLDDFIIYDSRVAIALAYIIERCFQDPIPPHLAIFLPPSRKADLNKVKVHSTFKPINGSSEKHLYSNIIASWIISTALQQIKTATPDVTHRDIEAALFMVGNDTRNIPAS